MLRQSFSTLALLGECGEPTENGYHQEEKTSGVRPVPGSKPQWEYAVIRRFEKKRNQQPNSCRDSAQNVHQDEVSVRAQETGTPALQQRVCRK